MPEEDIANTGDAVFVVDEVGVLHNGLVTNGWGSKNATINVLFLTLDENKRDQYGTQIERLSSCSHRENTSAPGRYWFKSGDRKPAA